MPKEFETPLRWNVERLEHAILVRVAGEIDSCTAPQLREHLAGVFIDAANVGQPVVLDLSRIAVFPSSGLSVLIDYPWSME